MFVCQCTGTTDRQIREALICGAQGEREVRRRCGAGTVCGGCTPTIQGLLRESVRKTAKSGRCVSAA